MWIIRIGVCAGKEIHTLLLISILFKQPILLQEKFIPLHHLSPLLENFAILLFQLSTHCFHLEHSFIVPPLPIVSLKLRHGQLFIELLFGVKGMGKDSGGAVEDKYLGGCRAYQD